MAFSIEFSEEKNQLLKATRGISFDEIIHAIFTGGLLTDMAHPNNSHANQRLYVVKIEQYAYAVSCVIDSHKHEIFLKTVYPSRVLTKKYIKGDTND